MARRLGISQQRVSRIEAGHCGFAQLAQVCRAYGLSLEVRVGGQRKTVAHAIDPEERREIEANIDWFSRLAPAERLRAIERHLRAARRLREAGRRAR